MFTANRPVLIFLDMPADSPLAKAIKQTLPSAESTHMYIDSRADADVVFDSALVERAGGLSGLVGVIAWVSDPYFVPLNSNVWIAQVLGMREVERIWCAAHK
ncbi:MAG: hypothetical protein AAB468_00955 [Patescibacteria group bacterium]